MMKYIVQLNVCLINTRDYITITACALIHVHVCR